MAITNFQPTLWEGALLYNFHNMAIGDIITTMPASVQGSKVVFNRIGAASIKDYTGAVEWDAISTTPVEMTFDKKKYFAIALDDCDAVQLKAPVMNDVTAENAAAMAEAYDSDILEAAAAGAASAMTIGSASTKKSVTPQLAYDYIVDLSTLLSKKKVPKANRYCVVNAEYLALLSKDKRFNSNPTVIANGVVEGQTIASMQLVASEELPANKIIALYKGAIGAAKQVDEVEAMRLETSFSDAVRGLMRYGVKALRDDSIAVLNYTVAATEDSAERVQVVNTTANPVNTKAVS